MIGVVAANKQGPLWGIGENRVEARQDALNRGHDLSDDGEAPPFVEVEVTPDSTLEQWQQV